MLNFIKGLVALVGLGFTLILMSIFGFGLGLCFFSVGRFMLMGVAEWENFAPLITDGIKWVFTGAYADIIQYIFIGGCTFLYPLNWYLGLSDENDNE
tara:strand:+ start:82 stop:372 length:291 start_codon:yes stop_codon:yes gene_type:complete